MKVGEEGLKWDKRIVPTAGTQAGLFYEVTAGRLAVAVNKLRSLCPSPHSQSSHLSNTRTVSAPRRFTDCSHGIRSLFSQVIVCVPHYVCVLPASHTEITCISSYSQANPPPIIVNADSLDAGPYVSICSLSLCTVYISLIHTPSVSVHECVCVFARVSVWMKRPPPGCNMLFAMWTDIHYPIDPACL